MRKPDYHCVRRRGRPIGSKDKNPGGRKRRTKMELESLRPNMALFSSVVGGEVFDEGETLVEHHVMLTVAKALQGDDRKQWEAAISKEEARLRIYETWQEASDVDLKNASQIIPINIILFLFAY